MNRRKLLIAGAVAGAAVWVTPAVQADEEKGYFGFSMSVDGEGFFLNPTVRSITIDSVVPDSPAAKGGLLAGDQVIEVEGVAIAGRKARELQTLAQRTVGQTLRLRMKHASGEVYDTALVAIRRPAGL